MLGSGLGLFALFLIFLGVSVAVQRWFRGERAARIISSWVGKSIAGGFTIGRVEYAWWPAMRSLFGGAPVRAEVWDFTISDVDGKEVIHADHVEVGVRLGKLVAAQITGRLPGHGRDLELAFVDAEVEAPRCVIAPDHEKQINLVHAFARRQTPAKDGAPPPPPPDARDGMVITVERARVHHAKYGMRFPKWNGHIDDFEMMVESLRYSSFQSERLPTGPAFTYHVSRIDAPTGEVEIAEEKFPLDHFVTEDFGVDEPHREDLRMLGSTRVRGARLEYRGMLTHTYSKPPGVDMHFAARNLRSVLAHSSAREVVAGDPSLVAHLIGPFTDVRISGKVRDLEVPIAGMTLTRVSASYRHTRKTWTLEEISADVADGKLGGSGNIDEARWEAAIDLRDIDRTKLGALRSMELLAYLASVPGGIAHPSSAEVVTHLRLRNIDITLKRRSHERVPFHVDVTGKRGA